MKQEPVWYESAYLPPQSVLTNHIEVEVAIVGGGITGLTAAYLLSKKGLNIALLESSTLGSGVTGHTTGHITNIPDTYYYKIIDDFGLEHATKVYKAMVDARKWMEKLIREEQISCDFKKVPAYYFSENEEQQHELEKEMNAIARVGLDPKKKELPLPVKYVDAFEVGNQAQFNSLKYLGGLAKAIPNPEHKIFENSHVEDISKKDSYHILKTKKGSVTAKRVILATHSPAGFNLLQTELAPYMSYVVAAEPEVPVPDALYYNFRSPYNYIRNYTSKGKPLMIIGGFDHKTGQADEQQHHQQLEQYVRENFKIKDIAFKWSAMVFEPADSLPYIGKSPQSENIFLGTGYSGDGLTFGTIAGMILAEMGAKNHHPWQELFDPSRIKPAAAGKNFIKENINVAKKFIKDRFTTDLDDPEEIPAGSGAIVNIDGDQIAAYRDKDGTLHYHSAVCTHLGCIVQWNNEHSTWDCPCHGSRFKPTGEVMSGPATKALKKKDVKV